MLLSNEEMMMIKGGGFGKYLLAGLGIAITFVIGIVDGYLNPQKCNK